MYPTKAFNARHHGGMALAELMIGMALSSLLLLAIMASALFIARTRFAISNYQMMDNDVRRTFDRLALDMRIAFAISTTGSSVTVTYAAEEYASYGGQVTYGYDAGSAGTTAKCLYKMPGGVSFNNPRTILARGVQAFTISRFDPTDLATSSDASTKKIRQTLSLARAVATEANTTQTIVSAMFVIRNKSL
jgi:Tfp pilus assembly protein PilW